MNRLCIYDTETTGLDPEKDRVIEVACVLYDIQHAAVVETYQSLIYAKTNEEVQRVNGIPQSLLDSCPTHADTFAWDRVGEMSSGADAIIAHRAEFDRSFTPPAACDYADGTMVPWICSKFDIEWPNAFGKTGEHLTHLALAHGVSVYSAHRAMADVDTLVRLFQRVTWFYGFEYVRTMLMRAMRPKVRVISLEGFDMKDVVKSHGFAFHSDSKIWDRMMPAEDVARLPFRTRVCV